MTAAGHLIGSGSNMEAVLGSLAHVCQTGEHMEPIRVLEQDSISLGLTFVITVNVEQQGRAFE